MFASVLLILLSLFESANDDVGEVEIERMIMMSRSIVDRNNDDDNIFIFFTKIKNNI